MYYQNKNSSLGWSIALVILVAVIALGAIVALLPEGDGGLKDQINDLINGVVNGGSDTSDPSDTTADPDFKPSEGDPDCVHTYGSKVIVKTAATCAKTGVGYKTCSKCGANEEVELEKLSEHKYEAKSYQPSNALYDAQHQVICTVCGNTRSEDHVTKNVTNEATCLSNGWSKTTCTVCKQDISSVVLQAKGHTVTSWVSIDNNTVAHTGVCTICGDTVGQDHVWKTDWIIDLQPVCEVEGSKHKECKICGFILTSSIGPLQHSYSLDMENVDGSGHSYTCSKCSDEYTQDHVIAPATCTADASCAICGYVSERALGHSCLDETVLSKDGKNWVHVCVRCGFEEIECSVCEADGHTYGGDNVCDVCGWKNPALPETV